MSRPLRSQAAANASQVKFGDGKLLRTKHIDTLEVLEDYSQELKTLQKENKELQQKLTQLSGGDVLSRLESVEKILAVERSSNQEMSNRIKIFAVEAERHRTEMSNKEIAHRQTFAELQTITSALHHLQDTHSHCVSSKSTLAESLETLERHKTQWDAAARTYEDEQIRLRTLLQQQSERLAALEQAANSKAHSENDGSEEALRISKAKLAKTKEKLKEKEIALAAQLEQIANYQAHIALIEKREQDASLAAQSSLQLLQSQYDTLKSQYETLKRKSAVVNSSSASEQEKKQQQVEALLEKMKKEKEENEKEKAKLQQQIETLKQSLSTRPSVPKGEIGYNELAQQKLQLQTENTSLRNQLEHAQAQLQNLKIEHTKVAGALNKLLERNGGALGNTITIASKKGMFPEFVNIKRENEMLHQQVAELQQTIHVLNMKIAQNQVHMHAAPPLNPTPPQQQQPMNGLSQIQQLQRVASKPAINKSLSLIAAHESSTAGNSAHSSASASPTAGSTHLPLGFAQQQSAAQAAQRAASLSKRGSGGMSGINGGWSSSTPTGLSLNSKPIARR